MKLFCVIVGDGHPFMLSMEHPDDETETVAELAHRICRDKRHLIHCDVDQLALFATRDATGNWLHDDDPDVEELAEVDPGVNIVTRFLNREHRMRPTRALSEYFDADTPRSGVLHVLVQLPAVVEAFTATDLSTTERLQELYAHLHRLEQQVQVQVQMQTTAAKTIYNHGEMTRTQGVELLQELGMYLELFKIDEPVPKSESESEIEPFDWRQPELALASPSAAARRRVRQAHRKYLAQHLQNALDARDLGIVASDPKDDVLRIEAPGKNVEFRGGVELLMLDSSVVTYPETVSELPRLRMVMQVHEDAKNSKDRTYQAVSQLLATDLLVRRPTMGLMTNLTDYWRFFWLSSNRTVHSVVLRHPANAFELMRNIVMATPSVTDEQKYWRSWFFDMLTNNNNSHDDEDNEIPHIRKASCDSLSESTVSSNDCAI